MNTTFKPWYRAFAASLAAMSLLCCCRPDSPPPVPTQPAVFAPTLEWIGTTRGVVMDVAQDGSVICAGDTTVNIYVQTVVSRFAPDGKLLFYILNSEQGMIREIIDDSYDREGYFFLADTWKNYQVATASLLYVIDGSRQSLPYTRYNTVFGKPDTGPYPWSGYRYVVGPSIAKGSKVSKTIQYYPDSKQFIYHSRWLVGSFTAEFNYAKTNGKADCFFRRYEDRSTPVYGQWGGLENDLAYDVASDDMGNPTIFLRAGSEFPITSASQSLVKMKTGYNVVTLDTNGLLTNTYPVQLQATGELTDAKIALAKNGALYLLAKDEARKQYFLARVSQSGTAWTRYFSDGVGNDYARVSGFSPRMDLCVDSKDNVYITGGFIGTADFGDSVRTARGVEAFAAKYSAQNVCLGALSLGSGMGVTIRLSPDETGLYINGWANGKIMGFAIPDQSDPKNGILYPGAFLLKLKL